MNIIQKAYAYTLLQPLPGIGGGGAGGTGLTDYLNWLFKFMLAAAAFLAVVQIVVGGIQMMIGGASETARSDAKKRIQDALWGLLLALASWLILWTINPNLAGMNLQIPAIEVGAVGVVTGPFDPGIDEQLNDASADLFSLIVCMRSNLPAGVGRISSISDSNNRASNNFGPCKTCPRGTQISGCAHLCQSCHYGGGIANQSYGVDFGDQENAETLISTATGCGADRAIGEGDHIHISINCPGGGN